MRKHKRHSHPNDATAASSSHPGLDFGWKVHAATQDWIKGVDAKASLTLAIIAALGLFAGGQVFGDKGSLHDVHDAQLWAVRVMAAAFVAAGLSALHAVFPSLKRRRARGYAQSGLIYFGHLRHADSEDIERRLASLDDHEAIHQLASQLDATAKIAWNKHCRLQRAQICLVVAVAAFAAAQLLTYTGWLSGM
jgi:hypothetical protein